MSHDPTSPAQRGRKRTTRVNTQRAEAVIQAVLVHCLYPTQCTGIMQDSVEKEALLSTHRDASQGSHSEPHISCCQAAQLSIMWQPLASKTHRITECGSVQLGVEGRLFTREPFTAEITKMPVPPLLHARCRPGRPPTERRAEEETGGRDNARLDAKAETKEKRSS
ncbi:hypothetical protein EYF80_023459 [Liparis tanakae]|uniref:Uncharacterized protein n=1 Tax=Liparis tanakae TaxID=230148 RepID=A0A4Z2HMY1_9TELE|nr:hypothetical protein EYF80_023459 [Liparis tanakae]